MSEQINIDYTGIEEAVRQLNALKNNNDIENKLIEIKQQTSKSKGRTIDVVKKINDNLDSCNKLLKSIMADTITTLNKVESDFKKKEDKIVKALEHK